MQCHSSWFKSKLVSVQQKFCTAAMCMAGIMKEPFHLIGKIIFCSCHVTWLPCKTSLAWSVLKFLELLDAVPHQEKGQKIILYPCELSNGHLTSLASYSYFERLVTQFLSNEILYFDLRYEKTTVVLVAELLYFPHGKKRHGRLT